MRKKKDSRELTAREFINVEAIEQDILWTVDKNLFAFIRVKGQDNSLLMEAEHERVTEDITKALADETLPFQILSVPRTVDTLGMIQELKQLRDTTDNRARLQLIDGEISALEELVAQGAKEPVIFLKIWQPAARDADRLLMDRAAILLEKLNDNRISAYLMKTLQIRHLCTIYAELGVWQESQDTAAADIPYIKGRPRIFTRLPDSPNELLEEITPVGGLFFDQNSLTVGSAFCRCYGVTRYLGDPDYGWLSKLTKSTDCITCITYHPGRSDEIAEGLSRSIRDSDAEARDEKDARRRKRLERKAKSADELIDDLDAKGKTLGHMSILAMPIAQSAQQLEDVCSEVVARFGRSKLKLKPLTGIQKEAFCHLSPYYPNQADVDATVNRIVPLETLMGGYPCTINTLRDDHGVYFARTADRSIISLDMRYRDSDRTSGNGIITGMIGIGKSTMTKHLILSRYMQGVRCFINDPEREYRDLTKNLGGSWWDAGGGNGKVNLLQVQAPILDEETDPAFSSTCSGLAEHIQYVKTMLCFLVPDLKNIDVALLTKALRELYGKYDIFLDSPDSWKRGATDYPIMEDYWRFLKEKTSEDPRYGDLALLLEDMAVGADSVIWNGYTNIDFSNPIVCVDTNRLYANTNRNRAAQYYNIMRMEFTVASADRTTPVSVYCDESQTMFNPELPEAAVGINNMSLRIRKYEGDLTLIFHSIQELLNEKVRFYGQPILDNATYKILFGTDGQNLADTVELFHLNQSEAKYLEARRRGKALALIGSQHLKVDFDIPGYKLALMGKGGGR